MGYNVEKSSFTFDHVEQKSKKKEESQNESTGQGGSHLRILINRGADF